eukprot:7678305-Pyramimonas_sp.AAC.1
MKGCWRNSEGVGRSAGSDESRLRMSDCACSEISADQHHPCMMRREGVSGVPYVCAFTARSATDDQSDGPQ